jgi:ubiquinone/menaquinone biosynthesis C-methylase UbiE
MTTFDPATRHAYSSAAPGWATGPERVYRQLAEALLRTAPLPVDGALLVDVGAGTGVVGDVATALGARCVEVDVAVEMLAQPRDRQRRGVAADGHRLPFRAAAFDVVTAACSLSHLDEPATMVAEARRILRPGGVLLASAFTATPDPHPVRACVEEALIAHGYRRPSWYERLRQAGERRVETPDALAALGRAAGFRVDVRELAVETGISTPAALVDYRLGMAQHVEFLATLDTATRETLRATAIARLSAAPPTLTLDLLVLVAHAW